MSDDRFHWDMFARLGERIGDGDMSASEAKYVNREYKRLSRMLVPEIDQVYKDRRKQRAEIINAAVAVFLENNKCSRCTGPLTQVRSGSKVTRCIPCLDKQVAERLSAFRCACGSPVKQSESGSLTVCCTTCPKKYSFTTKKKRNA